MPEAEGRRPNRLAREKSPYLLQHAHNPVDWYPWGEEAFAAARARDLPLFLSVGYATCHWCHVMERESFEDLEVAALLNEHFIPVKVDREELPHVDRIYMSFCQSLTGRGGWPLTVVMDTQLRPFFAGTYFPRRSVHGRPGLLEILPALAGLWRDRRPEVLRTAQELLGALARGGGAEPGGEEPGERVLEEAWRGLAALYDRRWGGFGQAPKFPAPNRLLFLLRYGARRGEPQARRLVAETLRAMRLGGIWDHLGGGLHRYSTDERWLLPHFEKMLYDQALLALALAEAFQATDDEAFRRTAGEVLAYVRRDLQGPEGAFYSAEDADSEGEEGKFYLWSADEIAALLGEEAEEFAAFFHVQGHGNFVGETGERSGMNILHRVSDLAASASDFSLTALPARLEAARATLFAAREKRVRPLRDDKVLADWNGLMIAAFARCGAAFGDLRLTQEAARAASFVLARLRDRDGRLLHRWRDGEAAHPAGLDDHAYLALGLLELHQATFLPWYLAEARRLADEMLARFWDEAGGGFFLAAAGSEPLPIRQKTAEDGALPSGNAVAAEVLLRLARLLGREEYEERARRTFRAFASLMAEHPLACAHLLLAYDLALGPAAEAVVVGEPARGDTRALLQVLRLGYRPWLVGHLVPVGAGARELLELAPHLKEMRGREGKATAYVCRDRACRDPVTDAEALRRLLEREEDS